MLSALGLEGDPRCPSRPTDLRYRALKLGVTVAGIGWGLVVLPRYAGWRGIRPERSDSFGRELRRSLSYGAGSSPPVRPGCRVCNRLHIAAASRGSGARSRPERGEEEQLRS